MKNSLYKCLLILFIILSIPMVVLGQERADSEYYKPKAIEKDIGEEDGIASTMDSNNTLTPQYSKRLLGEEPANKDKFGAQKSYKVNYYDIFDSNLDAAHSEKIKDFMNEQGKGIVSLFKYAQLQTEPSIATGSALASDLLFNIQRQALDSQNAFITQLDNYQDSAKENKDNYYGCLNKKISAGMTWLAAITFCQNDNIGERGDTPGTILTDAQGEPGLKPENNPNAQSQVISSNAGGGAAAATGNPKLNIVAQVAQSLGIENVEKYQLGNSALDNIVNNAVASNMIDAVEATQFAHDMLLWYGDELITATPNTNKNDSITPIIISPKYSKLDNLGFKKEETFDNMTSFLYKTCQAKREKISEKIQIDDNFWTVGNRNIDSDLYRKLSIPEQPLDTRWVDAILYAVSVSEPSYDASCEVFNINFDNKDDKSTKIHASIYNSLLNQTNILAELIFYRYVEDSIDTVIKFSGNSEDGKKIIKLIKNNYGVSDASQTQDFRRALLSSYNVFKDIVLKTIALRGRGENLAEQVRRSNEIALMGE